MSKDNAATKPTVAPMPPRASERRPVGYKFRAPVFVGGGRAIGPDFSLEHNRNIEVEEDDASRRIWFRHTTGPGKHYLSFTTYENLVSAHYEVSGD